MLITGMNWNYYVIIFNKIHFVCFNFFKDVLSLCIVVIEQLLARDKGDGRVTTIK